MMHFHTKQEARQKADEAERWQKVAMDDRSCRGEAPCIKS